MQLDTANLLLVKYEDGPLILVSSSFFSQEQFVPYDSPEIGEIGNGTLKIVLKVAESDTPASSIPTEELLKPVVHVIQINHPFAIVTNNGENEIDGEIEVTVLMGRADDPNTFTENLRSLKPSKVKRISAGGDARPIED